MIKLNKINSIIPLMLSYYLHRELRTNQKGVLYWLIYIRVQETFSKKGQRVNILGFVGNTVSVQLTTPPCHCY